LKEVRGICIHKIFVFYFYFLPLPKWKGVDVLVFTVLIFLGEMEEDGTILFGMCDVQASVWGLSGQ
jgi:hypothetical protein